MQAMLLWLENLSKALPIEVFAFLGAFIEEVVAPIPSPFVGVSIGTIAYAQQLTVVHMFTLAMVGSFGKTIGAYLFYFLGDKLEDIFIPKYGKYFGIRHKDLESLGAKLEKAWKADFFIFISRALPIIPSAPISVVCGTVKVKVKNYILATFLGNIVRNLIFFYIGYLGVDSFQHILEGIDQSETVVKILILGGLVGIVAYSYYKRRKIDI